MKLAVQDNSFFGNRFEEKLTRIRSLGFEGLEVNGEDLIERFDEIKRAVRFTGVPISSVCGGYRGWIGDFNQERRKQAIHDISEIMTRAGEIGATGVVVPAAYGMFSKRLPPFTPPRSEEEDKEVLLESLTKIEQSAQQAGTLLLLEPLNRYEDHMLNRLSDAAALIAEGGFSAVKIIADFFHMNIEESNIPESIHRAKDLIYHVHLADSHRYQPGTAHLDFVSGIRALKEIGFDRYMALECRIIGDPADAYPQTVHYLRSCIDQA
ncbi:xylose isomerase [Marinithermofilum abyssi]|uniref:Xylose isomerase n=1 Tax=Marinithermofilum abyssi TaxID=1571185 RepID=A0A8J2YD93_9BACL|nr:sugar phosphate isomerase/epimerase family protein [Marinithermofilum abyssi]GGE15586.1 xylose isomerase [Marinithermofilum abyssi]